MASSSDCYLGDKCRGPKYHVCLAGKPDTFPALMRSMGLLGPKKLTAYGEGTRHQAAMDRLREGNREQYAGRDRKILAAYKDEGLSMNAIVEQMKVSKDTVLRVLHEAKKAGLVEIRPKYYNSTAVGA